MTTGAVAGYGPPIKKIAVNAAVFFEKEKKGGVIGRCLHTSLEGCGGES